MTLFNICYQMTYLLYNHNHIIYSVLQTKNLFCQPPSFDNISRMIYPSLQRDGQNSEQTQMIEWFLLAESSIKSPHAVFSFSYQLSNIY